MDCHKRGKLPNACDALQKPRLTSRDVEILEESGIGHSSGEEKCYFGAIYSTIKSLERKLKKLKALAKDSLPLVHA